ncbi:MAG: hypothetical protein L6Q95_01045 [Planctomycetes bacterium]|nr:hypothetical protein [Planctomycetota bacterium]
MPLLLALLLLAGPRETLAGKFPGHSPEYLELHPQAPVPLPEPLPQDVDALCRLVEAGHGTAAVYEALGDSLAMRGESALAYRAFRKAHARSEPAAKARLQEKKDRCEFVPEAVIEEEERRAAVWVGWLGEYERDKIRRGEDPRDLAGFHARYGRAEEDLAEVAQARRVRWAVAMALGLLGAAAILGFVLLRGRRRA